MACCEFANNADRGRSRPTRRCRKEASFCPSSARVTVTTLTPGMGHRPCSAGQGTGFELGCDCGKHCPAASVPGGRLTNHVRAMCRDRTGFSRQWWVPGGVSRACTGAGKAEMPGSRFVARG
jgi:hypothetical protein